MQDFGKIGNRWECAKDKEDRSDTLMIRKGVKGSRYQGIFMLSTMYLLLYTTCLLLSTTCYARVGKGGKPGELLTFGAGARSFGFGKAFVSIADDASASVWNPAGLGLLDRKEITALHTILFENTNYDFVSYAHPTVGTGTFGLSFLYLSSTGFEGRDINNIPTGTFSSTQYSGGLSYGVNLFKKFFGGFSVKYFNNTLETSSSSNVSFSLGVLARPIDKLALGLTVNNLISVKMGDETEDVLPIVLRVGISYRLFDNHLLLGFDYDSNFSGWYLGGEYKVFKSYPAKPLQLFIRVGANFEELTAGFGVWYKEYGLDYAFSTAELGGSHRFSATVRFGESMAFVRAEKEKARQYAKRVEASKYYADAQEDYRIGDYDKALEKLKKAVELDPDLVEARILKEKLELVVNYIKKATDMLTKKGIEFYVDDQLDLSLDSFKHVLEDDPENTRVLNLAKAIAGKTGKSFDIGRKLDPIEDKIFKAKGKWLEGKYSAMITLCKEVLQIEPTHVEGLLLLGTGYYSLGGKRNIKNALRYWKQAQMYGVNKFSEKEKKQLAETIKKAEKLLK